MATEVNEGALFLELLSDPDETQFVYDALTGEQPVLPGDEAIRFIYRRALARVLSAPAEQKESLLNVVKTAKSVSYSDKDYSQADLTL